MVKTNGDYFKCIMSALHNQNALILHSTSKKWFYVLWKLLKIHLKKKKNFIALQHFKEIMEYYIKFSFKWVFYTNKCMCTFYDSIPIQYVTERFKCFKICKYN